MLFLSFVLEGWGVFCVTNPDYLSLPQVFLRSSLCRRIVSPMIPFPRRFPEKRRHNYNTREDGGEKTERKGEVGRDLGEGWVRYRIDIKKRCFQRWLIGWECEGRSSRREGRLVWMVTSDGEFSDSKQAKQTK